LVGCANPKRDPAASIVPATINSLRFKGRLLSSGVPPVTASEVLPGTAEEEKSAPYLCQRKNNPTGIPGRAARGSCWLGLARPRLGYRSQV
jgi:hypothetical protein